MIEVTCVLRLLSEALDLPTGPGCQLALFTSPPSLGGWAGIELSADGYRRQPVVFGAPTPDGAEVRNAVGVAFATPILPWLCAYAAVLDEFGLILASAPIIGPPLPYRDQVSFRPGAICLRPRQAWAA